MKICSNCHEEKELSEFFKLYKSIDGVRAACKKCITVKYKESGKKYREKNKDKILSDHKKWVEKNKHRFIIYNKTNKDKPLTEDQIRRRKVNSVRSFEKNKEKYYNRIRQKKENDVVYKFSCNFRSRISTLFRRGGYKKTDKCVDILGANFLFVKNHIECQFKKGMNWDNYGHGAGKWEIDHIIPISTAMTKEDIIRLNHYTNLQPLWWIDNMKKGHKIPCVQIKLTL